MPASGTRVRMLTVLLISGLLLVLPAAGDMRHIVPVHTSTVAPMPTPAQTAGAAYGRLPLAFAPNAGQADPAVRYLAHGSGFSLSLRPDALLYSLAPSPTNVAPSAALTPSPTLRFTFPGADPHPVLTAADPLPGTVNYFPGNDPAQWRTNLPTMAKVRYTDLYPGVDLTVYGAEGGEWEYDVTVAPEADPTAFSVAIAGADAMVRDETTGDLVMTTGAGTVRQRAPVLYQETARGRFPVAGGFATREDGTVGFAVGSYDRTLPLVIDPSLAYSTYISGTANDISSGIAVDASGNAYITGSTGPNFPTTLGAYQTTYLNGGQSAFVTKLNAAGTALVYSTYLGGTQYDTGISIAVDASGNAYVTGSTDGSFPTTLGAYQPIIGGNMNAFVTKLTASGSALVYSTYLGGTANAVGNSIAVDASGNAYVTGYAAGNFPTTAGAIQTTYAGGSQDAFVSKLNAGGSALAYSTYLGGNLTDQGNGIAVDGAGNASVTGSTRGGFPTTAGAYQPIFGSGGRAVFVTKLNASGTAALYSTYVGGNIYDAGNAIAVDASGDAYITGSTEGNFPTTPGAYRTTYSVISEDAFVTKLNPAGSALLYSTYLGGAPFDQGNGIGIDSSGDAYITGFTTGTIPTTAGAYQTASGGGQDAFMTKLNATGTALLYSTYLGGNQSDQGNSIAVDGAGNAYVTGSTVGNFPTTPGAYQTTSSSTESAFVTKFSFPSPPNPLPPTKPAASPVSGAVPLPRPAPSGPSAGNAPAPLPSRRP